MSGNRVVGGILALVGGLLILLPLLIHPMVGIQAAMAVLQSGGFIAFSPWLIMLIVEILALVGGIMALAGKKAGAIIALIMGIVIIMVQILAPIILDSYMLNMWLMTGGTSEYYLNLGLMSIIYVNLEAILILVGSIVALPGE